MHNTNQLLHNGDIMLRHILISIYNILKFTFITAVHFGFLSCCMSPHSDVESTITLASYNNKQKNVFTERFTLCSHCSPPPPEKHFLPVGKFLTQNFVLSLRKIPTILIYSPLDRGPSPPVGKIPAPPLSRRTKCHKLSYELIIPTSN